MSLRNYRAFLARFAFVLAIGVVGTSQVPAASLTIIPAADAFVTSGPSGTLAANNYGGAGALTASASGLPKGEFQSVLKFDLGSVKSSFDATFPGGWTVQSVTLQLTAAAPGNPIFNASAAGNFTISWMQNDSWAEGTGNPAAPTTDGISFATLPTFLSAGDASLGTNSFSGATSGAFTYNLALAPSFVSDVSGGNNVSLRMFAADATMSGVFNARSFGTASARPVLTVDAVPEPSGIAVLALVVPAVLARRRRHD